MPPTSKLHHVRRRQDHVRALLGVDQRLWTATQFLQASAEEGNDPATAALLRSVAHAAMPRPRAARRAPRG